MKYEYWQHDKVIYKHFECQFCLKGEDNSFSNNSFLDKWKGNSVFYAERLKFPSSLLEETSLNISLTLNIEIDCLAQLSNPILNLAPANSGGNNQQTVTVYKIWVASGGNGTGGYYWRVAKGTILWYWVEGTIKNAPSPAGKTFSLTTIILWKTEIIYRVSHL